LRLCFWQDDAVRPRRSRAGATQTASDVASDAEYQCPLKAHAT